MYEFIIHYLTMRRDWPSLDVDLLRVHSLHLVVWYFELIFGKKGVPQFLSSLEWCLSCHGLHQYELKAFVN